MKGPSLRYDTRVLRVFCCDACGRQVQTPGNVTSQTCSCSDPPKFMRPLERPRTVSPDVSRFISAPDPEELIEVPDVDEIPYVLHVPIKPPPPARFANRRKLYDDTAADEVPDFGEDVVHDVANESISNDDFPDVIVREAGNDKSADATEKTEADTGRSRRRRRGRGGAPDAEKSPGSQTSPRSGNAAPPTRRPDRGERPRAGQQSSTKPAGRENRNPNSKPDRPDRPDSSSGEATAGDGSATEPSLTEPSSSEQGDGRRRSRRRGRRRGPRPEGGGA
ncbi:MAG: hypothetical protein H7Z17_20940 [Fuerstia sp.]|nr:hypothetical protein [Fuerstiella sp.]